MEPVLSAVDVVGKELMCADVMCESVFVLSESRSHHPSPTPRPARSSPLVPDHPRPSLYLPSVAPSSLRFLSPLAQCSPQSFPASIRVLPHLHVMLPLPAPSPPSLSFVSRASNCATRDDDFVSRDSSSDLLLIPFHRRQLVLSSRVSAFWPAN